MNGETALADEALADIETVLGEGGTLAGILDGFKPRAGQLELSLAVARAMRHGDTLVAEAGTGIGKTFAYLVPALLSGARVLVSTGTRHLQDQLFHIDLPRLASGLGLPLRAELLKGRANYLCPQRLEQTQAADTREAALLRSVELWRTQTQRGDLAELAELRDGDPLRARITSTAENCLGVSCPKYDQCFVAKARARAQDADVVVVNHHLLCADLALKEDGFGELLPEMDAVIVDEAHQFPDVLAQFFGFGISARQCRELGRDVSAAAGGVGDAPQLLDLSAALIDAVQALQASFPLSRQRLESADLLEDARCKAALLHLLDAAQALEDALKAQAGRGPELAQSWRRSGALRSRLQRWQSGEADQLVRWAERQSGGFLLQAIPMDVAPAMDLARGRQPGAWIMLSATLAVAGEFGHYLDRLGLADARSLSIESPFDYARQSRLLLPQGLPAPTDPRYPQALLRLGRQLIEASAGGCFWLCTSQRAVEDYAYQLRQWGRYPVLEQGQEERSRLLDHFRRDGHAILVGTASFWEGVDVRGTALRLVIIDRLPFASPDDPMLKARSAQLQSEGRNPFMEYQVPQAILTLKQGAGRLIRDSEDHGVLVLGDARVQSKPYGRRFLASLPPMRQSRELAEVVQFLEQIRP